MSDLSTNPGNETSTSGYRVTADQLRQVFERLERPGREKKNIAEARKEVMAEARGHGGSYPLQRVI